MGILIQNSREDEDCRSSKFFSQLGVELSDRDLCSEPHLHLVLPLCERAARQILRDLPSFGEQERSKPPLGLLYSRQIHKFHDWRDLQPFWWILPNFGFACSPVSLEQVGKHSIQEGLEHRTEHNRKRERMLLAVCLRLARVCQGGHFGGGDQGRAPEVRCVGGRLEGATRSAHDHVVIGVMQTGERGQTTYYKAEMVDGRCRARKQAGYRSGMGRIFVEVASINPIS